MECVVLPQPVRYVLPNGFREEDLCNPAYAAPLAEAAAPMTCHCQDLLDAIKLPDFDGGQLLDCTKNGAVDLFDDLFETVAGYEEGRVPQDAAVDLVNLNEALLDAVARRYPALQSEIQSMGQAFRRSYCLWSRPLPMPRKPREVYLKYLFNGKERIIDAICAFNAALFHAPSSLLDVRVVNVAPEAEKSLRAAMKDPGGRPKKTLSAGCQVLTQRQMAEAFGEPCNEQMVANWEARAAGKSRGANPPDAVYKGERIHYSADLRIHPTPENTNRLTALISEFQSRHRIRQAVDEKVKLIHCRTPESLAKATGAVAEAQRGWHD